MSLSTLRARKSRARYDTEHEVNFIASIKADGGVSKIHRLLQYEKTIYSRNFWGNIDREIVQKTIKNEIAKEHSKIMSR